MSTKFQFRHDDRLSTYVPLINALISLVVVYVSLGHVNVLIQCLCGQVRIVTSAATIAVGVRAATCVRNVRLTFLNFCDSYS